MLTNETKPDNYWDYLTKCFGGEGVGYTLQWICVPSRGGLKLELLLARFTVH